MKINKKILIPVFASAMGLSVIGGVGGAVAWYQYNSKVTTSFIGTSVADTGVLQISEDGQNWKRDFTMMDGKKLYPVTFGELETVSNKQNCLPSKAYMYPEAGAGEGYVNHKPADPNFPHWTEATEGTHYYQFSLYFKAFQTDETKDSGSRLVARPVYITDIIFNSLDSNGDPLLAKFAQDALRIHVDVEGGTNKLFSNSARTDMALSGNLDLDGNGQDDAYHSTLWNSKLADYGLHPTGVDAGEPYLEDEKILYGNEGDEQTTEALSAYKAERDESNGGAIKAADASKALFTTVDDENEDPVKVTFTIWLEGWEALADGSNGTSTIWNPKYNAGCEIQLGLRFDTGAFRGSDLTPAPAPQNP